MTLAEMASAGGRLLRVSLPVGVKRYRRVVWRVAGATLTAGNFTAFITTSAVGLQYTSSGQVVA